MAMARWIVSLICLLAVLGGPVHARTSSGAAKESLGRIVFLPKVNSECNIRDAPYVMDSQNVLDLAKTSELDHSDSRGRFFENSNELIRELAREIGIKGCTDKELRFSVESEFCRLAGPEKDVVAAEVHAYRLHSKSYIPKGPGLNDLPLNNDFKNDFRNLPVCVKDAHEDRGWQPFHDFMHKWGSHIVEVAYTGAIYQSWSTACSRHNYNQQQMEARACVKAEGPKGDALEACKRYNQKDREEAERLNAHDTRTVRGGNRETRRRLEKEMATRDLIEKFLKEDKVDEEPVGFKFMPVWEFLLERTDRHSDDGKRALALQAYYQGWRATGCPLVMTTGQPNNNAQMMVPEYTKSKTPTGYYMCIRRCRGCHDHNNDCHFDEKEKCCRAYGPSALRRVRDTDYVVRAPDYESGWCSANNGCEKRGESECHCVKSNQEEGCNYEFPLNPDDASLKYKIIWNQEGSHGPRDFESLLAMEV